MAAGFDYGAHMFTKYLAEGQNYYENDVHRHTLKFIFFFGCFKVIDASETGLEGTHDLHRLGTTTSCMNLDNLSKEESKKFQKLSRTDPPWPQYHMNIDAVEDLPRGIDNPTQLIASFDKKELNVYQASWSSRCISLEADVVVVGFYMSLDQS
ncbi:hypothetical protein Tco_0161490 [Tanacetum coccineum]